MTNDNAPTAYGGAAGGSMGHALPLSADDKLSAMLQQATGALMAQHVGKPFSSDLALMLATNLRAVIVDAAKDPATAELVADKMPVVFFTADGGFHISLVPNALPRFYSFTPKPTDAPG
jgi:hypothetical protein